MKLIRVQYQGKPTADKIDDRLYRLTKPYYVELVTNEGLLVCDMLPGWITDYRSGCSIIDPIIPWKGNDSYNAIVLAHDFFYSGWISKKLADDLLCQGMKLSGEIGSIRSNLVHFTLDKFGESHYYDLNTPLQSPYQANRHFEKFKWLA